MAFDQVARAALIALGLTAGASAQAIAQQGLDEPFQKPFKDALDGKTVAFIPVAMNFDLTEGWYAGLKKELEPYGVKFELRDPNWNTNSGAQAVTSLIFGETGRYGRAQSRRADLRQAPAEGGERRHLRHPDQHGLGLSQLGFRRRELDRNRREGRRGGRQGCDGKSNKIAIMQGALSAAASAYTLKGVENVLAKHPEIKVVSSQAADWDAAKAKAITQTVLKQNPDLCGIVGFWDGMDIGTAAAVKEAGLTGKVFVATSGGGERKGACELVKTGALDLDLSYDVPTQAAQMAGLIKYLLSSGVKPGSIKGSSYTTLIPITKDNASSETACWNLSDLKK